jgi:hypothetical protein
MRTTVLCPCEHEYCAHANMSTVPMRTRVRQHDLAKGTWRRGCHKPGKCRMRSWCRNHAEPSSSQTQKLCAMRCEQRCAVPGYRGRNRLLETALPRVPPRTRGECVLSLWRHVEVTQAALMPRGNRSVSATPQTLCARAGEKEIGVKALEYQLENQRRIAFSACRASRPCRSSSGSSLAAALRWLSLARP